MKNIILLLLFFHFTSSIIAQSKKEINEALNTRIDSLNMEIKMRDAKYVQVDISNSKYNETLKSQIKKYEIDHQSAKIGFDSIQKINNQLIEKNLILHKELAALRDSVSILNSKLLSSIDNESETINEITYMKNNLNNVTFRNGDTIKLATNQAEWLETCRKGIPACCYYNFDNKSEIIGLLYNYYAFIDGRNLAPKGFRLLNENDELPNSLTIKVQGGTLAGQTGEFFGKNEFTLFWSLCIDYEPYVNHFCFWKILPEDNPIIFEKFPECQGMFIRCIKE